MNLELWKTKIAVLFFSRKYMQVPMHTVRFYAVFDSYNYFFFKVLLFSKSKLLSEPEWIQEINQQLLIK